MDEPFSGLDVQLREAMQEETLKLLRETRATCLMVTHNPDEAMRFGDRIAVMRGGRIAQIGRAEELYREPVDLFVARLFSEINEIPMTVEGGFLRTPFGRFSEPTIAEGEKAVLCIRRRAMRFVEADQGVAGRVLRTRFLGDAVAIDVAVEGFEQPLTMLTPEADVRPRGSEVRVSVDAKGVLVFAADDR
jgi:iron(III) transport system ATP-binding protein